MRTFLTASCVVGAVLLVTACPGLQQTMDGLNKPAPSLVVSPSSSSGGDAAAPVATTLPDGGPAGTCEASCLHYLACKQIGNGVHQPGCVRRCAELKRTPSELAQYETTDCATAISLVDGPSLGPGLPETQLAAAGGGPCPAPMAVPRSANDEKLFQVATTKVFCGWTYNKNTGTSREMRLRFLRMER